MLREETVIERRLLRFETEALSGLELPCVVASGAEEGPRLALIAGIHGCEYSSISAVIRFLGTLDTHALRGTVTAVPVVDRKSTRLNSSHTVISYAVFCLKKKKIRYTRSH